MKKLFALLAVVLGVVSCQNDLNDFNANVGGEQEVMINVALPEGTRADSAVGAISNVDLKGDLTIRYIFQVYNSDFSQSKAQQVKYSDATSVSFPVRLVPGRDYNFVVWADIVENANPVDGVKCADWHYNTDNLNAISLNGEWNAMDETRDAYTVSYPANNFRGTESYTLTLKRPFAKLRVITTDMHELMGVKPQAANLVYTTPHYNTFNALNGAVSGAVESKSHSFEYEKVTAYEAPAANQMVLFADYFFASANDVVKFRLSVEMDDAKANVDRFFTTDIPVKRNHLTTLIGNVLTEGNDIEVRVEEGFDGEIDWSNTDEGKLFMAAMNGGEVVLNGDVALTAPLEVKANMTIDLNGYSIKAGLKQEGRHHYAIDNYASLTLKGEGSIIARGIENFGKMTIDGNITIMNIDTNGGSAIWNEGDIVINGGTFTTTPKAGEGSYGGALSTQKGGSAVINGGTFIANSQLTYAISNYGETVINDAVVMGKHGAVAAADSADIKTVINGGSFSLMENPGVSDHCTYYVSDIKGGSFTLGNNTDSGAQVFYDSTVAAGFKAVENNGVYYVVAEGIDAVATSVAELANVAENATVYLIAGEYTFPSSSVKAGQTIICEEGTVFTGTSGLNINGATVIGAEFKNENGIAVRDYINGTFKNCTFTGSEALRWCYSKAGTTNVFENCVIKTDFRGFHFDGMEGDVIFRNCEINGFNAYGGEGTATFEGCTFGCDQSRYNGLNIYSNTNLINCTFNFVSGKTNFIDMEGTGKTLKITNCVATLDGANVDIKNYVGGSQLSVNTVIYE